MISIVIVNYKMKRLIKNCVQWFKEAKATEPFEIIVVDNNSQDDAETYLRKIHPEIRYIQNEKNLGMGAGTNVGIKDAKGEFVLLMNPDIFVFPGAIDKMLQYLKVHDDVGIIAPQLLNPDGSLQYSCYKWHKLLTPLCRRTILGKTPWGKRELHRFLMIDWNHNDTQDIDWAQGSCWLARKDVLMSAGLFDERFFMYFEDADLCRRIWQMGKRVVYLPEAKVIHLHRRQSADKGGVAALFDSLTREHVKSWIKYLKKHGAV
ncbi:glycosyltransferase family 2 protein [Candidatus Falkowbacteria bacterium]|nr:glycosyltransferase family 2 protein [Candidatus Falkowbacteria bacterium]